MAFNESLTNYQFGCIYKVTNLINGKVYVGQTTLKLNERWKVHVYDSKKPKKSSLLHRSIAKYGKKNFVIEPIVYCTNREFLDQMEDYFIQYFNALAPNGYTLRGSTHKGQVITDEIRKKMSEAKKGKPSPNKGKKASKETRQKQSEAKLGKIPWNKGKKMSQEFCSKMSLIAKARNA